MKKEKTPQQPVPPKEDEQLFEISHCEIQFFNNDGYIIKSGNDMVRISKVEIVKGSAVPGQIIELKVLESVLFPQEVLHSGRSSYSFSDNEIPF